MQVNTERRKEKGERKLEMGGNLREGTQREEERFVAEKHCTFRQGHRAVEGVVKTGLTCH